MSEIKIVLANTEPIYQIALEEAISHARYVLSWDEGLNVSWINVVNQPQLKSTPYEFLDIKRHSQKLIQHALRSVNRKEYNWDVIVAPVTGLIPCDVNRMISETTFTLSLDRTNKHNMSIGPLVDIPKKYTDEYLYRTIENGKSKIEDVICEMGGASSIKNPYEKIYPLSKQEVVDRALCDFAYTLTEYRGNKYTPIT